MTKKHSVGNISQNPGGRKTSFLTVPAAYDNPMMKDELASNGIRKDSVFGTDIYSLHQHDTYEASPCDANYRNSVSLSKFSRPTLDELHGPAHKDEVIPVERDAEGGHEKSHGKEAVKFGWVRGVYLRCILNIWGVMLFLRMAWMTGQAGISGALGIIILSTVVTMITTMSMSAICTNGEVKGGGAYYLISRSLGPEIGGAVGIIFSFANSLAVAMYIVGAGEAVRDILRVYNVAIISVPSDINDIRISGIILLILVASVTGIGMAFENVTQIVLLILLLAALMNYFVGACLTPTPLQFARGFVGWSWETARDNLLPDYRDGFAFFSVFSIFFPSVIGILAGANISGDLKNPSSALPIGTFSAIITTSISYILVVIWTGFTLVRDATGDVADIIDGSFRNCTIKGCQYGMMNYNQMMEVSAGFGALIYVGIFAATLSSALAALVSAPRLFQALCKDELFPYIKIFAKGYGRNNDPRLASGLAFLIALAFTCYGDLNKVAPLISNFYMATYCLINFACFHASLVKSPGFRPGFKYYNKWISAIGAILCIVVMFIMSWITALVTLCIVVALYMYIQKTKPAVNWGSSAQGFTYKNAMQAVLKLNRVDEHVKNYRPAILVLTGNPYARPSLVDFTNSLTKNTGLMFCGHVIKDRLPYGVTHVLDRYNNNWLRERGVKAFYNNIQNEKLSDGVDSLFQVLGLGKLRPNILLIGFKNDWDSVNSIELQDYFEVIHHAFDRHLSVAIFRVKDGLNYGKYFGTEGGLPFDNCSLQFAKNHQKLIALTSTDSSGSDISTIDVAKRLEPHSTTLSQTTNSSVKNIIRKSSEDLAAKLSHFEKIDSEDMTTVNLTDIPDEVMDRVEQFHKKQNKGTIDVWWLYDDGGLTMLMPYLLTTRAKWSQCELRVFSVTQTEANLDQAQVNMAALLKKFRIAISSVTILSDPNEQPPSEESKNKFKNLIAKWTGEENSDPSELISKTDLTSHKRKTCRHLRLRELLEEHSKEANLIVMSLPMPRKGSCPAHLYMAWLEILTQDMPPFLLVRGNHTNMLTFYS